MSVWTATTRFPLKKKATDYALMLIEKLIRFNIFINELL